MESRPRQNHRGEKQRVPNVGINPLGKDEYAELIDLLSLENIPRPTVYRALNRFLEENFIVKSSTADRGFFKLPAEKPELSREQILRQASTAMLAQTIASQKTELNLAQG